MYRWYEAISNLNIVIAESSQGMNRSNNVNLTLPASLNQPCVLKTSETINDSTQPFCDEQAGLTCVVGMYQGNGPGTNTGICLSNIGHYCDTLYDCVPSAQACINNLCENLTESINQPCVFDSDCIGGITCSFCSKGIGPCKNDNNECVEYESNGKCPSSHQTLCNQTSGNQKGEFRFNHICDTSLDIPKCKYNFAPKDQGCTSDSDCIQPDGGSVCYTGKFRTFEQPDGTLIPPQYPINILKQDDNVDALIQITFGNSLLTVDSFEAGTEIHFIPTSSVITRTAVKYGPYYIREQYDNDYMTIMGSKLEPSVSIYYDFPVNLIRLNEDEYSKSDAIKYGEIKQYSEGFNIVFGVFPANIVSKCYYDESNNDFKLADDDSNYELTNNVIVGSTEVRFNIVSTDSAQSFYTAPVYILSGLSDDGKSFSVAGELFNFDDLKSYNSQSNYINVLFGEPIDPRLLDANAGVCVMKLPPSANIATDSKYNLTEYTGNPCINMFDGSIIVSAIDSFCEFTNVESGPGSVCQFKRETFDPLPCNDETITYEGIEYKLECLINDSLTETVRNNPNFLNSSFAGICAYPVFDKFKNCELYNKNCKPPYVCTEFEGGYFCDSRFDVLQCNDTYKCPPTFVCTEDGGTCLSESGGYCVEGVDFLGCIPPHNCSKNSVVLGFYNSTLDDETNPPNQLVQITTIGSGSAKDYRLFVGSEYDDNNNLITYVLSFLSSAYYNFTKITNPLSDSKEIETINVDLSYYTDFIFDDTNSLWGYYLDNNNVKIKKLYPIPNSETSYTISGTVLGIDIHNNNLLVTSQRNITSSRPKFTNLDVGTNSLVNEYLVTLFRDLGNTPVTYILPYFSETLDTMKVCKFDLLSVNNTELDIVCVHESEDFQSPILGVRHKVREINVSEINKDNPFYSSLFSSSSSPSNCTGDIQTSPIGCYIKPIISSVSSTTLSDVSGNIYAITSKYDINTIYAFSNLPLSLDGTAIDNIYTKNNALYISTEDPLTSTENLKLTINQHNANFLPFSINSVSNIDNYGNTLSPYLEYPYWIKDLQDLIVGDNFNPKIKRIMYEPNRINRNYYAIADMYTGFANSPIENKVISDEIQGIENQNMYLFKFSSLETELGLTVNETLPIRVTGPEDITRFGQCNQTGNLFFVSNICS